MRGIDIIITNTLPSHPHPSLPPTLHAHPTPSPTHTYAHTYTHTCHAA